MIAKTRLNFKKDEEKRLILPHINPEDFPNLFKKEQLDEKNIWDRELKMYVKRMRRKSKIKKNG